MINLVKVYIASAYTLGDTAINVKAQLDMADTLINLGFAPFAPLYSHFQHIAHPQPYEVWALLDLEWIKVCDCLLRLPGKSGGGDIEDRHARDWDVPVYYGLDELLAAYKDQLPLFKTYAEYARVHYQDIVNTIRDIVIPAVDGVRK